MNATDANVTCTAWEGSCSSSSEALQTNYSDSTADSFATKETTDTRECKTYVTSGGAKYCTEFNKNAGNGV